MRPQDWPALLDGYVAQAKVTPFAWGRHDCVSFVSGWFKLMTGRDVYARFADRYDNEIGAHRVMLANGVRTMGEAGRFLFGDPADNLLRTGRGDIVLASGALGLCVGARGVFLKDEGVEFFRMDQFELSWSV